MKILFLGGHLDRQVVDVIIDRTYSTLNYTTSNGEEKYFPWFPNLYMACGTGGYVRRFKVTVGIKKNAGVDLNEVINKMRATAKKAAKKRFGQYKMVLIEDKFFNQDHHIRGTYDFYIYFPKGFEGCADSIELERDLTSLIST